MPMPTLVTSRMTLAFQGVVDGGTRRGKSRAVAREEKAYLVA